MSSTDVFSWLPDWINGIDIKYRFDTVINVGETGNEQARMPLYERIKRSITLTQFSPDYLSNIENFLRKMHADFFQLPIFPEAIMPVGTFGSNLSGVTAVQSKGLLDNFNLNNLCNHVLMVDLQDNNRSELHTLVSVDSDTQMTIGGAFALDFFLGNTVYFPVMKVYTNEFSDDITTPQLVDSSLTFEEYF
jgi:hypothetical protein